MATLAVTPQRPLTITVEGEEGGQAHTVALLRWCFSEALSRELAEAEVSKPYVFIVVSNGGKEMSRYLVPAKDMMRHITFYRSGSNVVHVRLVWSTGKGNVRDLLSSTHRALCPVHGAADALLLESSNLGRTISGLKSEVAAQTALRSRQPEALAQKRELYEALGTQLSEGVGTITATLSSDEHNKVKSLGSTLRNLAKNASEAEERAQRSPGQPPLPDEDYQALQARVAELDAKRVELWGRFNAAQNEDPDGWEIEHRDLGRGLKMHDFEAQYEVVVPNAMFAQPWAITSFLGSRYSWSSPPRDGCHLRKRACWTAGTYAFYALAALLYALLDLGLAGALLLVGMRDIDFKPIRHPFVLYPNQIWAHCHPSRWWTSKHKYADSSGWYYKNRSPVFWVLNPPAAIVVAVGLPILVHFVRIPWALVGLCAAGVAALCLMGWVVAFAFGHINLPSRPPRQPRQTDREARAERERAARALRRQRLQEEFEKLTCACNAQPATVIQQLMRRPSVTLAYNALKAQVCKPFSK